ncbi:MAG: hypothetical protein PHI59_05600 [Candidatus Omnitrophica bacterium]|nr:hypothetical protein [Candidatus Omnitrophota bacterium]
MSLKRYFTILITVTILGLCYAHQQFLIVEANYTIKKRERIASQLLDRNTKLRYTINALESPANLEIKLAANGIKYNAPKSWVVVKRAESRPAYRLAKNTERRNTLVDKFFNFITVKAEAKNAGRD